MSRTLSLSGPSIARSSFKRVKQVLDASKEVGFAQAWKADIKSHTPLLRLPSLWARAGDMVGQYEGGQATPADTVAALQDAGGATADDGALLFLAAKGASVSRAGTAPKTDSPVVAELPASTTPEGTVTLQHGTTSARARSIVRDGPDAGFVEPGGGAPARGFSTAPPEGPFPMGSPRDYALGKARLFPEEGGAAVVEMQVPESVVRKAAVQDVGEIRFEPGYGLEEIQKSWSTINKTTKRVD